MPRCLFEGQCTALSLETASVVFARYHDNLESKSADPTEIVHERKVVPYGPFCAGGAGG